MKYLGKSLLTLLLVLSFFVQWETEGQDNMDGNLTIYKVDRFTGQRWEIKYIKGNSEESPVFSEKQIENSILKVEADRKEINRLEKGIENQKKIMDENKEEHENFIDPNFIGNYELPPESPPQNGDQSNDIDIFYKMGLILKGQTKEQLHEKATESLTYEHIQYLTASKKITKLTDELEKLNNEITDKAKENLTSRAWIIRNGMNVFRIGMIVFLLILIYLKMRKPTDPYHTEM